MTVWRTIPWLIRHPMAMVFLLLALFGGAVWGLAQALAPRSTPPERPGTVESGVAPSRLPEPTEFPPRQRVDEAHQALHAVGRACKKPTAAGDAVRRAVAVMEKFARDYPNGGFTIDDEAGTTLALLIVLRSELEECDPTMLPSIEELIPEEYRDSWTH